MASATDAARTLAGQPWLISGPSRKVLGALAAGGREARFVGGCVRDGLLGRATKATDLDIATPERPARVQELLADAGIRVIPTGLKHGTVTALVRSWRYEITTLRRDVACDGRHAEVAFTDDFVEDAARRDFTINAMSCDGAGRLFDPFGGHADLLAGRVRFVGDPAARIREDYLRILRFFRFHAHYGSGDADPDALAACGALAAGLDRLSGERIRQELFRLLEAPDPVPSLQLMVGAGVLARVLCDAVAIERLAGLVGDAAPVDPVLRLAALLRPPPAETDENARVAERWRLSNAEAERLEALATHDLPAADMSEAEARRWIYRLGGARFADLLWLARAGDPARRTRYDRALVLAEGWAPPALPISGQDAVDAGVPAGPAVGRLLGEIEAWWVAGDFGADRAACLAELARSAGSDAGPEP